MKKEERKKKKERKYEKNITSSSKVTRRGKEIICLIRLRICKKRISHRVKIFISHSHELILQLR